VLAPLHPAADDAAPDGAAHEALSD